MFLNFFLCVYYILTQLKKVPIHELSFVSMFPLEVKSSDFHFLKKEYPFACATVQYYWIFLTSVRYKNA